MRVADYITGSLDLDQYLADLEQVRLRAESEDMVLLTRIIERLIRDLEAWTMEE